MLDWDKKLILETKSGYLIRIEHVVRFELVGWQVYVAKGKAFSVWIAYEGFILKTFLKAIKSVRKQNETTI